MNPGDVPIPDPEAALTYLRARAANRPGEWFRARTLEGGRLLVRCRVDPVGEGDPGAAAEVVEIGARGRLPDAGERYRVDQALTHLGASPGEPEVDEVQRVVRYRIGAEVAHG